MKSFEKLKASLRRLPGIGPKQAERMALYLVRAPAGEAEALVEAVREARARLRPCRSCCDLSESPQCPVCLDPSRDSAQLCVVEDPFDVLAIERSHGFRGRYHVLQGALSPQKGVGPESLRVRELLDRLRLPECPISEVILATDPDAEGEATALFLHDALKGFPVKVTRIALGVPMGGDLDYVDERTLSSALTGRREF